MERRLAAIMAADVVGYSRLIRADEEGTLRALKALRAEHIDPKLREYNGRIVKLMGDGMLAEFPSVVDAVRAAVETQQAVAKHNSELPDVKRIEFRVGINLGDVVIDGDDIQGDGVNVAARLEGLAEPGGICISGKVYEEVRDRTDLVFEDQGEQAVKNIDRPVRVWRWRAEGPPAFTARSATEQLALPDKPSIAVLPFTNMSGDPEQEYFADGMTEDIITELSRFDDLFVIARNTSFTYKGQPLDVKDVARELGVHFVLEGSVRKSGQRVRITAQLINGTDGNHVWAERYDGALEDVFDLQEAVTSQVVGGISPQITQTELDRIGRGDRKFDDAHELAWSALGILRSGLSGGDPSMVDRAIAMATKAVEINAGCGVAYQTICFAYTMQSLFRWGEDPMAAAGLAEDWARKFHARQPQSYMAFHWLGMARFRNNQYQEANRDFRRAHELNPNDPMVLNFWSWCEASTGDFEAAKAHAHMALRLSPKDPYAGTSSLALAMAAFIEKDAAGFEEWAGRAIQAHPNAPIRRALMIAYAAEAGDQALLKTHLDELMRFAPDFIGSLFRGENQLFQRPEHMDMLLDGLRKAGLPE
jgi:adenylate cyclase